MSAIAEAWTWKHSPYRGAAFCVHLALADIANDANGMELWVTNSKLATKARCGRQRVNEILQDMVDRGLLFVVARPPQGVQKPVRYRFLMPEPMPVVWAWADEERDDQAVPEPVSRPRRHVAPGDTSPDPSCRPRRQAHVASGDKLMSPQATQTQEGTQEELNPVESAPSSPPQGAPKAKKAPKEHGPHWEPATVLAKDLWENVTPRRARSFVGLRSVCEKLLANGWTAEQIRRVAHATVWTHDAFVVQLTRAFPQRPTAVPPSSTAVWVVDEEAERRETERLRAEGRRRRELLAARRSAS